MAGKGSEWFSVPIAPEIESLARKRCAGFNFSTAKSQGEVMRDCWIQGFIDRGWMQEKIEATPDTEEE